MHISIYVFKKIYGSLSHVKEYSARKTERNAMLEEREGQREREWERNKPAIVYIWHANGTVGDRDGGKIEKEAGQRGTHRLCSDTAGCLISDIDKSVNRERNSLP